MIGETRRRAAPGWNWFPVLSFTSALAALALVAVIVLQFAPGPAAPSRIAMQPDARQMESPVPEIGAMRKAPASEAEAGDQPFMMTEETTAAVPEEAGSVMMAVPPGDQTAAAQEALPEASEAMEPMPTTVDPAILDQEPAAPQDAPAQPQPEEPPALAAVPETPAQEEADMAASEAEGEDAPPVILWNGGYSDLEGRGGGGGVGGGMDGGTITLPQESVDALEHTPKAAPEVISEAAPELPAEEAVQEPAPTLEPTPTAQPAEPISGSGPILGVAQAGEGGQIVDSRAVLSAPETVEQYAEPQAEEAPALEPVPAAEMPAEEPQAPASNDPGAEDFSEPSNTSERNLGLSPAALLALQIGLAAVAIGAGVAAYLVRQRRRRQI